MRPVDRPRMPALPQPLRSLCRRRHGAPQAGAGGSNTVSGFAAETGVQRCPYKATVPRGPKNTTLSRGPHHILDRRRAVSTCSSSEVIDRCATHPPIRRSKDSRACPAVGRPGCHPSAVPIPAWRAEQLAPSSPRSTHPCPRRFPVRSRRLESSVEGLGGRKQLRSLPHR